LFEDDVHRIFKEYARYQRMMDIREFASGMSQVAGMQLALNHIHLCQGILPVAYFIFCLFSLLHHVSLACGRFNKTLLHLDMYMQYINCVIYVGIATPMGVFFSFLAAIVLSLDLNNIKHKHMAYVLNATMIGLSSIDNIRILMIWAKVGIFFAIGIYYDNALTGAVYHLIAHTAALEMWKECHATLHRQF